MKWVGRALALASVGLVAAVFLWEQGDRTSPGPLHPAHARETRLLDTTGCPACHGGAPARDLASACAECHPPIAEQLQSRRGLHGSLAPAVASRCGKCHLEHHGARALIDARAFAAADVADPKRYDHAHIAGFSLTGAHTELACDRCHPNANAEPIARGQARFIGLAQSCTACHEDTHRGTFGTDCQKCHGQQGKFTTAAAFRHTERFPLTDAHAGHACKACHADGERSIAALMQTPADAVRACATCHATPHDQGGTKLRIADSHRCETCHDTRKFTPAKFTRADHARAGFALQGPHAELACARCHGADGEPPRWPDARHPQAHDCQVCHADPHREAFTAAGPGCIDCHAATDATFRGAVAAVTVTQHAATGFALVAPHDRVDCTKCHSREGTFADRHSQRRADDCRSCHTDPHREELARDRACRDCHATTHFLPTDFGVAAHANARFPLTGAHQAIACARCHVAADAPAAPKPHFKLRPLPTACAECHRDVHEGRFERRELPTRIGSREGCARCHGTESFRDVQMSGAEHGKWTGFALNGAHAKAQCVQCHAPTRSGTGERTTRQLGRAPQRCDQCHADPHAGQFREQGGTDCARCHDDQSFKPTHFDHARHSRFALDRDHAALACSACHRPWPTPEGQTVIRYKPLGTKCADCHAAAPERRR